MVTVTGLIWSWNQFNDLMEMLQTCWDLNMLPLYIITFKTDFYISRGTGNKENQKRVQIAHKEFKRWNPRPNYLLTQQFAQRTKTIYCGAI